MGKVLLIILCFFFPFIAVLIHDGPEYALYQLSHTKLFPAARSPRRGTTTSDRRTR